MTAHRILPTLALTLLALTAPGLAIEHTLTLDPESTHIAFDLEATGHDVHGTLALRDAEIRFDPQTGIASGTIAIDAQAAETGKKSRDEDMHEKVLESESFPLFLFTAESVVGALPADGDESSMELVGTLAIHGSEQPLTLAATVRRTGADVTATLLFDVPYVEWGMRNPSILFLKVADVVAVTVETQGTLAGGPTEIAAGHP